MTILIIIYIKRINTMSTITSCPSSDSFTSDECKQMPPLYRFNEIVEMLDNELECPDGKNKCFSPQTTDFWKIHDNQMILKTLENDPYLPLRAYMYLKKIKYLQLDVKK